MSLKTSFIRNSSKISSWAYCAATTILVVKDAVQPWLMHQPVWAGHEWLVTTDTISSFGFYYSSYQYQFLNTNPQAIKKAGAALLVASAALLVGGWRGSITDAGFWLQSASMLPTAWAGVCFLADRRTMGSIPELASRPVWMIAGVLQGDPGRVLVAALCALGETGIIASSYAPKAKAPKAPIL